MKNGIPWRERLEARKLSRQRQLAARAKLNAKRASEPDPHLGKRIDPNHNPHKPRGIVPWDHGRPWADRIVCIVGGGPSLKDKATLAQMQDAARLHPHVKWIAINNSYLIAPWADILHFADAAWWGWNRSDVLAKYNGIISTSTSDKSKAKEDFLKRWWRDRLNFSLDPQRLHGYDGGTQCINMAYLLGARKIVLWGIDMQPAPDGSTQWHKLHKRKTATENYAKRFAPLMSKSVAKLAELGVPVVRVTEPGLPCVPHVTLPSALELV